MSRARWSSMGALAALVLSTALAVGAHPAAFAGGRAGTSTRLALPFVGRSVDIARLPAAPTAPPTVAPSAPPASPVATSAPTRTAAPTSTPTSTAQPTPSVRVEGTRVTTAHYDLVVDGLDGADIGRMLETAYPRWSAFFGGSPDGRLPGKIFGTLDGMKAAMAADGITYGGGGGYYHPANRTFYAFAQPSAFFTRMLILHEATHQFHFLAATGNRGPAAEWYTEGLAEYFGMHNWDGKTLQTGVVPSVTLEDYPAQASKQLAALEDDAQAVAVGTARCDRPLAWALVHYLVNVRPGWWRALSGRLDDHELPSTAWANACGEAGPDLGRDLRAWIDAHQQPLRIAWIAWQERGELLEGKAGVVSAVFFKEAPASFEAEIELVSGDEKAGIAFNRKGDEYSLFQVLGSTARVVRREGGAWKRLASADVPAHDRATVSFRRDGADAVLSANGVEVFRAPFDGEVGLNVEGCCARFRLKP